MYNTMKTLVEIKHYGTLEYVIELLTSFATWGQLTPDEYNELMLLAKNVYNPHVPEVLPEEPMQEELAEEIPVVE